MMAPDFVAGVIAARASVMLLLQELLVDCSGDLRFLHSFPTRRSSDLLRPLPGRPSARSPIPGRRRGGSDFEDRKSTRLNSSHVKISYAVFCLKKKKRSRALTACCRSRLRKTCPTLR